MCSAGVVAVCVLCRPAYAIQVTQTPAPATPQVTSAPLPPGFVIGPEDVLAVVFWGEKDMSVPEVVVRPDGKISLPLINEIQAAGYTPEQLTTVLMKAASKYVSQPNVTVIVRVINSRKVFILGQVGKPGAFSLTGDMTVLQLIAQAGDVLEYAKSKDIVVARKEEGRTRLFRFNYKDVVKGKKIEQNILLKPGDTVIVP